MIAVCLPHLFNQLLSILINFSQFSSIVHIEILPLDQTPSTSHLLRRKHLFAALLPKEHRKPISPQCK
jgi:hypothetical protein